MIAAAPMLFMVLNDDDNSEMMMEWKMPEVMARADDHSMLTRACNFRLLTRARADTSSHQMIPSTTQ